MFIDPHDDDHIVTRFYTDNTGSERESTLGRDTFAWDRAVERAKVGVAFL